MFPVNNQSKKATQNGFLLLDLFFTTPQSHWCHLVGVRVTWKERKLAELA